MNNPVVFVIVFLVIILFYVWVAWIVLEWRKATRKAQLHKTLIERFPSAGELQAFLASEGGERLFRSLSIGVPTPQEKILRAFTLGIIVTLLGLSLMAVSRILPEYASPFLAGGIIGIALGVGLILSGFLSMKIGGKWGLFDK